MTTPCTVEHNIDYAENNINVDTRTSKPDVWSCKSFCRGSIQVNFDRILNIFLKAV